MRKIAFYLMAALVAVSCGMDEMVPELPGVDDDFVEGEVTADLGVVLPGGAPCTKAFSDEPDGQIRSLYVAVFDDSHYLTQYLKAECEDGFPTESSDGTTGLKRYKVTFNVAKTKPRIVHIIANGPATVKFGNEEEVMASMLAYRDPDTSKGQIGPDVYWNRLVLPEGISYDPTILDASGHKTLVASSAEILRKVGLIRNFAKFNIQSKAADFVLTEAKILMSPDVSYVSAYNKTKGEFVMNYADLEVKELLAEGYIGSAPATSKPIAEYAHPTPASSDGVVSEFMFEREKPTSAPACVIVGGKYRGSSTTTYYKVNLVDEKGEYYPIMRNFNYLVTIAAVSSVGKASIREAYESAGSGDISTSFEFEDLPEVSNGISVIEVEYTDKVVVSDNAFTLQYRFTPDVNLSATNNKFIWCTSEPTAFPEDGVYVYLGEESDFGAAIADVSLVNDAEHESRGVLRITPVTPGAASKLQTINFIGVCTKDGSKVTIRRKVTITVREKFTYSISCDPSVVPAANGSPFTVNISIPSGLRQSLFPLHVQLEAEKNTISPDTGAGLPVEMGMSCFDPARPGYHFVKAISWEEYYHGDGYTSNPSDYTTVFPCRFVTVADHSTTRIMAVNGYFNDAETLLRDEFGLGRFTSLQFSNDLYIGDSDSNSKHPKSSRTTSFSFRSADLAPVTVTITGASYEGTEMTALGGDSYLYTPSTVGVHTITGIVANTYAEPVTVSVEAEGYVPASASKGRFAIYPKNSFTSFISSLDEAPGVASWSGNVGTGKVSIGSSTSSKYADVPVTVTRTVKMPRLDAPAVASAAVSTSGFGSGKVYTYTGKVTNYDSSLKYYYSSDVDAAKKELTVKADGTFSIAIKTRNDGYVDIYAYDSATARYSHPTTLTADTGWFSDDCDVTNGSAIEAVYTYQCAGPVSDVKVEFSEAVTATTPLVVYHGTTIGWSNTVDFMFR